MSDNKDELRPREQVRVGREIWADSRRLSRLNKYANPGQSQWKGMVKQECKGNPQTGSV